MKVISEFKEFLKEYKILALAIAIIFGAAATSLVTSLVNNIIMPLLTFFIPKGTWQFATLRIGPAVLSWGAFLGQVVNFLIIALIIFLIVRFAMKENKVKKR